MLIFVKGMGLTICHQNYKVSWLVIYHSFELMQLWSKMILV